MMTRLSFGLLLLEYFLLLRLNYSVVNNALVLDELLRLLAQNNDSVFPWSKKSLKLIPTLCQVKNVGDAMGKQWEEEKSRLGTRASLWLLELLSD